MTRPTEKLYTVQEIADWLSVSERTALRMFGAEPGVLRMSSTTKGQRWSRLRIPQSVLTRVIERVTQPGPPPSERTSPYKSNPKMARNWTPEQRENLSKKRKAAHARKQAARRPQ